jgi:hypothetical protein
MNPRLAMNDASDMATTEAILSSDLALAHPVRMENSDLADLSLCQFSVRGRFSTLDWTRQGVQSHVFRLGFDLQILKPIVLLVFVYVVDFFIRSKWSAYRVLYHQIAALGVTATLGSVMLWSIHKHITVLNRLSPFPFRMERRTAAIESLKVMARDIPIPFTLSSLTSDNGSTTTGARRWSGKIETIVASHI